MVCCPFYISIYLVHNLKESQSSPNGKLLFTGSSKYREPIMRAMLHWLQVRNAMWYIGLNIIELLVWLSENWVSMVSIAPIATSIIRCMCVSACVCTCVWQGHVVKHESISIPCKTHLYYAWYLVCVDIV